MSLPRYPKYKESGVEWLGEVPEHWRSVNLRWIAQIYSGGTPDKLNLDYWSDGTVPWLNSGSVNDGIIMEPSTFITQEAYDNSSAKWIQPGALVLALAGQGKTKGMVAQLGIASTCNQSMAAIVPAKLMSVRFLYWWLASNYQNIRNMAGGDLRDGLNLNLLGNISCPLLPTKEQDSVAAFLDRETAKIDALVEEQRRLIELLKEKRQAVISHAVTKGLNPNAPMKDSGIEWLGKMPRHWHIGALRNFAKFNTGATPDRTNENYWNGGIPWVKTGEIDYATITNTEETISQEGLGASSVRIAPPGTLLMAMYGQGVTRGRVALLGIPATYNQACAAIQPDERINERFLHAFFTFAYQFIREIGNETTQMNLNVEFLQRIRVVVPSINEQIAISNLVEVESAKLQTLTAEATRAIDLLQERRTALISAAVTGKIDVRGMVPKEAA